MPAVRLQISPNPAQVRTARLVATAVARRSGVGEDCLDEIRLAVGEACSRAVTRHRATAPTELVTVLLRVDGKFEVSVCDVAPGDDEDAASDPFDASALDGEEPWSAGFGLAVIGGLVDDLTISRGPDGLGTVVRMSWPLASGSGVAGP